ncbi:MAG TPA: FAD:protein FMN transferase, partial [Chthoniobacterales bacterium]|nr:FAD:protein FMN transferase [Chthoniobacterales bacterium]
MKSRSNIEIRRCRPLLGTLVEIGALGRNEVQVEGAISAAFASVAKVHRLMGYYDPRSDVSHMNREAFPKSVIVHPWTWRVLDAAQQFARESNGAFSVTIAPTLAGWRYLPRPRYRADATATWRDIFLRKNCRVFFRRQLTVDLGGIAKGFAVDRAVEVLKRNRVMAGIVNAGGDLRVFGSVSQVVHVRHPRQPNRAAGAVRLRERAIATSAIYFSRTKKRRRCVSPILDARTGRAACEVISVTVGAANCMTADALTKVVFALREEAAPLLA